jgi:dCTP deaminase
MGVVPFITIGANPSVIFDPNLWQIGGEAILIINPDQAQFAAGNTEANATYDLRVGNLYRDHRDDNVRTLGDNGTIELLPGQAVIIETEEEVRLPRKLFGHILPKVGLLQKGIANTPSKIDPGYIGRLVITAFNHGKRTENLDRRQKFCTLYLLSVDDDVRPYNKGAKGVEGRHHVGKFEHWRDRVEGYIPFVLLFTLIVAIIGVIPVVVGAAKFVWLHL